MKLLSRILTAAVLIALAVTAGVWLAHPPLAAATGHPTKIIPEPAGAPLPIPAPIPAVPIARPTTPIIIEVPVEVEIAGAAPVAEPPPTMRAAETKPKPQSNYPPARRGLFRRR
jgi:hypothetical protein